MPAASNDLTTVEELREWYSKASGKAGDLCRQLALAGIAVVWLFGGGAVTSEGGLQLREPLLLWVGLLLVVSLTADFLQYVYSAALWGAYARRLEARGASGVPGVDRRLNWPTLGFFWAKLAAMLAAYALLVGYFVTRL